jgi:serine/threonine protein kinase
MARYARRRAGPKRATTSPETRASREDDEDTVMGGTSDADERLMMENKAVVAKGRRQTGTRAGGRRRGAEQSNDGGETKFTSASTGFVNGLDTALDFGIDASLAIEAGNISLADEDYVRCEPMEACSPLQASDPLPVRRHKAKAQAEWNAVINKPKRFMLEALEKQAAIERRLALNLAQASGPVAMQRAARENHRELDRREKRLKRQMEKFRQHRQKVRADILSTHGIDSRTDSVGAGGFGRVYKFKYTKKVHERLSRSRVRKSKEETDRPPIGRICALKIGVAITNNSEKAWLRRIADKRHGNIIRFYDVLGKSRDSPVYTSIMMEYANSGALTDFVIDYNTTNQQTGRRLAHDDFKPFPEWLAWTVTRDILSALVYLQYGINTTLEACPLDDDDDDDDEQFTDDSGSGTQQQRRRPRWSKILHNDIKSDNILVQKRPGRGRENEYRFILTDFGLAKWITPTGVHGRHGTPQLVAPEWPQLYPSSDVWSVGYMLHHMTSRQKPRYLHRILNPYGIDPVKAHHKELLTGANRTRKLVHIYHSQPVRLVRIHDDPHLRDWNYRPHAADRRQSGQYSRALSYVMHLLLGSEDGGGRVAADRRPSAREAWLAVDHAVTMIAERAARQKLGLGRARAPTLHELGRAALGIRDYDELLEARVQYGKTRFEREYYQRVCALKSANLLDGVVEDYYPISSL